MHSCTLKLNMEVLVGRTVGGRGLRSTKMCLWISPEPPSLFFSPSSLSCLSSASPSAGVSNTEIRNITIHGEHRGKTHSATRDKISAKRMHTIPRNLTVRFELAR